jgi:hypothetical protein
MARITVVLGSTREGRMGERVANMVIRSVDTEEYLEILEGKVTGHPHRMTINDRLQRESHPWLETRR